MPTNRKKIIDLTDEQKLELEFYDEAQLCHLQRNYSMLKRNRAVSKPTNMQRVIELLENEKEILKGDLSVMYAPGKRREDLALSRKFMTLLDKYDYYTKMISTKKAQMVEMHIQLHELKKRLEFLRGKHISDLKMQERFLQGQLTLDKLESKLEVETKKFCNFSFENKQLREIIDHLLKERAVFDKFWTRLINNLYMGKRVMSDLINQGSRSFNEGEEWCSKLIALRKKAKDDLSSNIQDMKMLCSKVDGDLKLCEFCYIKNGKRIMIDTRDAALQKRRIKKKEMQKVLQNYTDMLDRVYEFAGNKDIRTIIDNFSHQESENIRLFKQINMTELEIEELNEKLNELREDIDCQKVLKKIRTNQQATTIEQLRKNLSDVTNAANMGEMLIEKTEYNMKQIFTDVSELVKLCKCKEIPSPKETDDNAVTMSINTINFLELLEDYILESLVNVNQKEQYLISKKLLLHEQSILRGKTADIKPRIYSIGEIVKADPCPMCMERDQVQEVIDSLQKVLDRKEIQIKLKRMQLAGGLESKIHTAVNCASKRPKVPIELI